MTKAMGIRLGAFSAILTMLGSVRAEESKEPQPYVVVVGVGEYGDKDIKARAHAEDDAKALYDLFTNKDYLGVDAKHVRLLLGKEDAKRGSKPATRENILDALKWATETAKPTDKVIFTFIGQSAPIGKDADRRCYLASDSTLKNREKDAVSATEIAALMKKMKSQQFAGFIDVEFVGFSGNPRALIESVLDKDPFKEFLGDDGSLDHAPLPGRVVFVKTNGAAPSLDLKDHGIFTTALLEGLSGKADTDGYEPDGLVIVDELIEYLDKRISKLAMENGKTREEKAQLNFVLGSRGNHFMLTKNPAVTAKVEDRLKKLAKLAAGGKVSEKLAEEGKNLLSRMPRLESQRELRKLYQSMVDGTLSPDKLSSGRDAIIEGAKLRRTDALTFAQKVLEATQLIKEMYVKETNQGELVSQGVHDLYRRLEEKLPADIEDKLKDAKSLRESELLLVLTQARQQLGKREDLAKGKDVDLCLAGVTHKLDRYSEYISPERLANFIKDINAHFTGIGVLINKDVSSDQLLVVTPIKDSPAYKAGLQAGDIITKIRTEVDGKTVEKDTKGMSTKDAVKLILGAEGSPVTLTLKREGEEKPIEKTIRRDEVEVETVIGVKRKADDGWDFMIDPEKKIGYVRLTQFSDNTFRDLRLAMLDLVRKGIRGFVLDLRNNPGGLLSSARDVTDLFIEDGVIVTVRKRNGSEEVYRGSARGSLLDFPMVCMVNGMSASGSEIVSAALQDHHRALIVGERSYGKGSVQSIEKIDGGKARFKLTTASFWRPNGKNLNKASTPGKDEDEWGVTPNKIVKFSIQEQDELAEFQRESEIIHPPGKKVEPKKKKFEDRQLDAALEYLRDQIKMAGKLPGKKAG
jgi:C-terminal peptidase prc